MSNISRTELRSHAWAALYVLLIAAAMFILDRLFDAAVWEDLVSEPRLLNYFCERSIPANFFRQPANTYTNLSYAFTGFAVLIIYRNHSAQHPLRYFVPLYGVLLIYTFLGSAFFHASLGKFPERMDLSAVYGTAGLPLIFSVLLAARKTEDARWAKVAGIVWLIWWMGATGFVWEMQAKIVVPIMVGVTSLLLIIGERRNPTRESKEWLWTLSVGIPLAVACFFGDIRRIGCVEDGWLTPHGIWHLMAALAMYAFARYMYVRVRNHQPPLR